MTVLTNNFEGGTNNVAVSGANSGGASGTAFTTVFGAGLTYKTASAYEGSMGAQTGSGTFGAAQNTISTNTLAVKMWFKTNTSPSVTNDVPLIRVHAGATRLFSVHMNTIGKLRVSDATGTSGVNTFATVIPANTWFRLEIYVVAGSTTSNGVIKAAYYLGNSTTPVDTLYSNTAANIGTAQTFTTLYIGKYATATEVYDFDAFSWDTAATDLIGMAAGTAPTVSTPANQNVSAAASVNVAVTASGNGGTIASYLWSYVYPASGGPTLSNSTTNTVSFTAGSAGALYKLQCLVTDSNALTTTVYTEVRVPTSGDAVPLSDAATTSTGSWSNVGGAANGGAAIGDSSDSTYVESATLSASAVSTRYRLQPMTARSAMNVTARLAQDTSGSTTIKVRLFEGSTQLQEWTQAITTSFANYTLAVTTPGAITDWGNLYLEFVGTAP